METASPHVRYKYPFTGLLTSKSRVPEGFFPILPFKVTRCFAVNVVRRGKRSGSAGQPFRSMRFR